MAYTVKKMSELSGVTIRTLHFYEKIGLLEPAYHGSNGYRYYQEKELLLLQQILFFKELGFSLKQIQKVLGRSDFDQLAALHSHKKEIEREKGRLEKLLKTIDKTINHLQGISEMETEDLYGGFITEAKQKEYQEYWENRLGKDHPTLQECEKKMEGKTKEDFAKYQKETDAVMKELTRHFQKGTSPASQEVQELIAKHHSWLKQFWTPNRESYTQLGEHYLGFEWKKFFNKYDPHHPKLAQYLADGMKIFAEKHLS